MGPHAVCCMSHSPIPRDSVRSAGACTLLCPLTPLPLCIFPGYLGSCPQGDTGREVLRMNHRGSQGKQHSSDSSTFHCIVASQIYLVSHLPPTRRSRWVPRGAGTSPKWKDVDRGSRGADQTEDPEGRQVGASPTRNGQGRGARGLHGNTARWVRAGFHACLPPSPRRSPRETESLPAFLVSRGSVLAAPCSPSLSSHAAGAGGVWGPRTQLSSQNTSACGRLFPGVARSNPDFIPSEQQTAANEKAVTFRNAPTPLSTLCKFFLNSHNKSARRILCPW